MIGTIASLGLLSNEGKSIPENELKEIMNLNIEKLSIQVIPLYHNTGLEAAKLFGRVIQRFIHPAIFSPTLSHIAIQITLDNNKNKHKYNIIIEYGQYYSEKSDIINTGLFSSSNSSKSSQDCRKELNELTYYYINKDGARLIIIPYDLFSYYSFYSVVVKYNNFSKDEIAKTCLLIMACNHYHLSLNEFIKSYNNLPSTTSYSIIECEVQNKITINQLCQNFKGKNWEAKDYNVTNHNCQHFAAEVIKILKAGRIHEVDKIRAEEKSFLPNCIISALWDNEKLSAINTIGRIPIIGLLFDITVGFGIQMNELNKQRK